jgi:hypothetical protein
VEATLRILARAAGACGQAARVVAVFKVKISKAANRRKAAAEVISIRGKAGAKGRAKWLAVTMLRPVEQVRPLENLISILAKTMAAASHPRVAEMSTRPRPENKAAATKVESYRPAARAVRGIQANRLKSSMAEMAVVEPDRLPEGRLRRREQQVAEAPLNLVAENIRAGAKVRGEITASNPRPARLKPPAEAARPKLRRRGRAEPVAPDEVQKVDVANSSRCLAVLKIRVALVNS